MYKLSFNRIARVAKIEGKYVATNTMETTKSISAIRVSFIRIRNGIAVESIFSSFSIIIRFDLTDFKDLQECALCKLVNELLKL